MSSADSRDLDKVRSRMEKAIAALKEEFGGLRSGRASASLIEPIMVEAYGSTVPINQVGAISVPEPRMITVNVWDKGTVVSVEKAIRNAGIGLNPVVEGNLLRIPIPPLTEERRRDLAKLAGKYAEQQRVAVRNIRRDAMDALKAAEKKHEISEDERTKLEKQVQEATDAAIKKIDEALKVKEQEIMQV